MALELINGRGQLGTELAKLVDKVEPRIIVYHTWNILDKSEKAQNAELRKYEQFLAHREKGVPVVFISTKTNNWSPYLEAKRSAEAITMYAEENRVIRIPTLIGRGVCEGFRSGVLEPFGEMELLSVRDAAVEIVNAINSGKRTVYVEGDKVAAHLARKLVRYGGGNE